MPRNTVDVIKKTIISACLVVVVAWIIVISVVVKRHGWELWCGANIAFNIFTITAFVCAVIGLMTYRSTPSLRYKFTYLMRQLPLKWESLINSGITKYFNPEVYIIQKGKYKKVPDTQIAADRKGLPIVEPVIPLHSFNMNIYRTYHANIDSIDVIKEKAMFELMKSHTPPIIDVDELQSKVSLIFDILKEINRIDVIGDTCLVVSPPHSGHLLIHRSKYKEFESDSISDSYLNNLVLEDVKHAKKDAMAISGLEWFLKICFTENGYLRVDDKAKFSEYYKPLLTELCAVRQIANRPIKNKNATKIIPNSKIEEDQEHLVETTMNTLFSAVIKYIDDKNNNRGYAYLSDLHDRILIKKYFIMQKSLFVEHAIKYLDTEKKSDLYDFYKFLLSINNKSFVQSLNEIVNMTQTANQNFKYLNTDKLVNITKIVGRLNTENLFDVFAKNIDGLSKSSVCKMASTVYVKHLISYLDKDLANVISKNNKSVQKAKSIKTKTSEMLENIKLSLYSPTDPNDNIEKQLKDANERIEIITESKNDIIEQIEFLNEYKFSLESEMKDTQSEDGRRVIQKRIENAMLDLESLYHKLDVVERNRNVMGNLMQTIRSSMPRSNKINPMMNSADPQVSPDNIDTNEFYNLLSSDEQRMPLNEMNPMADNQRYSVSDNNVNFTINATDDDRSSFLKNDIISMSTKAAGAIQGLKSAASYIEEDKKDTLRKDIAIAEDVLEGIVNKIVNSYKPEANEVKFQEQDLQLLADINDKFNSVVLEIKGSGIVDHIIDQNAKGTSDIATQMVSLIAPDLTAKADELGSDLQQIIANTPPETHEAIQEFIGISLEQSNANQELIQKEIEAAELKELNESLKSQNVAINEQFNSMVIEKKRLEKQLQEETIKRQAEINQQNEKRLQYEAEKQQLEKELQRSIDARAKIEQSLSSQINDLMQQQQFIIQQAQNNPLMIQEANARIQSLQYEIEKLNAANAEKQTAFASKEAELTAKIQRQMQTETNKLFGELEAEFTTKTQSINEQLQKKIKELNTITEQKTELVKQNNEINQTLQSKDDELTALRMELEQIRAAKEIAVNNINEQTNLSQNDKVRIAELDKELKQLQGQTNTLGALEQSIKEKDIQLQQLQEQYEKKGKQNTKNKKQLKKLQSKLEDCVDFSSDLFSMNFNVFLPDFDEETAKQVIDNCIAFIQKPSDRSLKLTKEFFENTFNYRAGDKTPKSNFLTRNENKYLLLIYMIQKVLSKTMNTTNQNINECGIKSEKYRVISKLNTFMDLVNDLFASDKLAKIYQTQSGQIAPTNDILTVLEHYSKDLQEPPQAQRPQGSPTNSSPRTPRYKSQSSSSEQDHNSTSDTTDQNSYSKPFDQLPPSEHSKINWTEVPVKPAPNPNSQEESNRHPVGVKRLNDELKPQSTSPNKGGPVQIIDEITYTKQNPTRQ